jgi:AcrR family transcriptional regulator
MRADAARNLHRIVEVAARLLGNDPQLAMADVAVAAGVSRATLYRHFATREALIDAIRRQSVEQGKQALELCRLDEGSATDALRRVVAVWLDVARRYSFPQLAAQIGSEAVREDQRRLFREPLLRLMERGQAAGELSAELPPAWGVHAFGALLLAAARAVDEGSLSEAQVTQTLFDTLLKGLRG